MSQGNISTQEQKSTTSWDSWNSSDYLNTYFAKGSLGTDSYEAWKFLIRELQNYDLNSNTILDFGCGPTLFSAIPTISYASELHMCDYLQCNLDAINSWIRNDSKSFDWSNCIKDILKLEKKSTDQVEVVKRETELRRKIRRVQKCDAGKSMPLEIPQKYSLIVSTYCVDSATSSKEVWRLYMKNLLSLLDASGTILLTALRNCESYKVGNTLFPCANIDEKDMEEALIKSGFESGKYNIEICEASDCVDEGFSGLLFVRATR